MNREEFEKLLFKEPDKDIIEEIKRSDILTATILPGMPEKLYRFRSLNVVELQNLLEGKILPSYASNFNDPFDGYVQYHLEKIKEWIYEGHLSPYIGIKWGKHLTENERFDKHLKETVNKLISKKVKIVCFTEDITNSVMWAHYSDSQKGFALEYDLRHITKRNLNNKITSYNTIFLGREPKVRPVIYRKELYDASHDVMELYKSDELLIVKEYKPKLDEYYIQKIFLVKQTSWEYEKEWRVLIDCDDTFNVDYIKYRPSAIIFGCKMPATNKKILYLIARNIGIDTKEVIQTSKGLELKDYIG